MKAQIWNKKGWIELVNPIKLKDLFTPLLKEAGFDIVAFEEYYFKPFGYSAVWIITESHFAIHTFPEENKTYWELSSCSKEKFYYFLKRLKKINLEDDFLR